MAAQPNQIECEIPDFAKHPGDGDMGASQVLYSESYGSEEEVTKHWLEEKAKTDALEAQIPRPKTYEEYLFAGSAALKQAAAIEREHGLEASVEDYEIALVNFAGVLSTIPFHDGQLADPDPVFLIELAGVQDRLATSERLKPYRDSLFDRRESLRRAAINNLKRAGQLMFGETNGAVEDVPTPPAEVIALAAVVTRAVLNHQGKFEEAKDTWTSMRAIIIDDGTAPGAIRYMDSHANNELTPGYRPQKVATGALQALATRTHADVELELAK